MKIELPNYIVNIIYNYSGYWIILFNNVLKQLLQERLKTNNIAYSDHLEVLVALLNNEIIDLENIQNEVIR